MRKTKTAPEVAAEIQNLQALRGKIRPTTAFGDDNEAALDAQIAVLRGGMADQDIYEEYEDPEDPDSTRHVVDHAIAAQQWRDGEADDDEAPSVGWQALVKQVP